MTTARISHTIYPTSTQEIDIAEFYHNEHATVDQTYEEALFFAKLVTKNITVTPWFMALEESKEALDAHRGAPEVID